MQQVKWKFVLRFVVEIVLYLNHQLFEIQCVTVDVHVIMRIPNCVTGLLQENPPLCRLSLVAIIRQKKSCHHGPGLPDLQVVNPSDNIVKETLCFSLQTNDQ